MIVLKDLRTPPPVLAEVTWYPDLYTMSGDIFHYEIVTVRIGIKIGKKVLTDSKLHYQLVFGRDSA
jgi:hypothetical protein